MFLKSDHLNKIVDETDSLAGSVATKRATFFSWNKPAAVQEERALEEFLKAHPEIKGLENFAKASISYNLCIEKEMQSTPHMPEYFCADSIREYRRTKEACYLAGNVSKQSGW